MGGLNEEQEKKFISAYHLYVDEIYQYVYLRIGWNQEVAEDLTQEIFMEVYRGYSRFRGLCSERTWIFKIARNKLNDFYRKQYSQKFEFVELSHALEEGFADSSQDIEEGMIRSLEREKVRECLNALPVQYQIVLVLKYMDEKSVKEIAAIVGKSPKAVESILQRAKKAFIGSYANYEEKEGL